MCLNFFGTEKHLYHIFSLFFRKLGENLIQVIDATTFKDSFLLFGM